MDVATATLLLPGLLRESVGATNLRIRGRTLREALEDAYLQIPVLRHHLCDESGGFRPHVLCFLNGTNTRGPASLDAALRDGDEIAIVQAVSGG